MTTPRLSVVVIFYNMQREAARTLYTLGPRYQRNVAPDEYEVIAVDNGSSRPLDPEFVASHGPGFRYLRIEPGLPSPCAAINQAVAQARGEYVMVCIDGARMLSPGVLHYTLAATRAIARPFVYTLGMHLGARPQNELIETGYCQDVEDQLLDTVDWRADGYRLFSISSVAYSSRRGFFSRLSESNCFTLARSDYAAVGGMDERFASAGGGLANLDFFNRANAHPDLQPVMLLGEASFHQFHGGVATNVRREDHPWPRMAEEYAAILGRPYALVHRPPVYLGSLSSDVHAGLAAL